jgi:hypothetical protein
MNIDTAELREVEEFLRAHGGRWAGLPDSLALSIRDNRDGDAGFGETAQPLIVEARNRSYEQAVRNFAKACQRATQI